MFSDNVKNIDGSKPTASRRVYLQDKEIVPGQIKSTLTVIARYNDFYQMGLISVFLPLSGRYQLKDFQACEIVEGAEVYQVIKKARDTYDSLIRQLTRQEIKDHG